MAQHGIPDVVIANAGISQGTLTENFTDLKIFEEIIKTNLFGVQNTFYPFIQPFKKKVDELKMHAKDTGSSEVQIALLTGKIETLSAHIKQFKKDKHSSVGLLRAVNRRKKLLEYLKKNKFDSYKNVLTQLNLRK